MTENNTKTPTSPLPADCDKLNEFKDISINNDNYMNNNEIDECEAADESITTDSEDYSVPLK